MASTTVIYAVGTETLKFKLVASVSSFASGSPEARTFWESADGTKAMLTGLPVEPFWSPLGIGGAAGFGTLAAAGLGLAAAAGLAAGLAAAAGDAAGLAAADGDAATAGLAAGGVVGLAGALVGGGLVGCAAGAAG